MASHVLPYRDSFGTGIRPYLALQVIGVNGQQGQIIGVIDSGADGTALPYGYAPLMGYTAADLRQDNVGVADGSTVPVWVATKASQAFIVGLPQPVFDLFPTFVQGASSVLWGRSDVFMAIGFAFDEPGQRFTITV